MEESATTKNSETVAGEKPEIRSSGLVHQKPEAHHEGDAKAIVEGETRGVKRPAEDDEDDDDNDNDDEDDTSAGRDPNGNGDADSTAVATPLSKNQQKKLKRQKRWEEKKVAMKEIRKEKRHNRKERKKLERETEIVAAATEGREPVLVAQPKRKPGQRTHVPVTVIIDCQFEKYMMDKELVSLCSQVTRCYSDNRSAQFPIHTFVSSYSGAMKTRYETVMENQHQNWKGLHFREGDFLEVAKEAKELMAGPQGGKTIELLETGEQGDSITMMKPPPQDSKEAKKVKKSTPLPEPEADDVDKSIVYLTADSPYTLERLEPHTCYIIGGIIDKNREKGLCYQIAREKKVRTAKLPIGEFMVLQSRHILATNHVMDIMLKYLELGDWGAAFMKVIPPRKGGKLKDGDAATDADDGGAKDDNQDKGDEAEAVIEKELEDSEMREATENADQPSEDVGESEEPSTHEPEVEGANAEEGLQKNALGEREWSAPPVEQEKIPDLESATIES